MVQIISTTNTVLSTKKEVTEGVPVEPAAATDFIKIESDLTIDTTKEELDNDELTGSIGQAESIPGVETPTVSFSKYLYPSGVEGQAPQWGDLLESMLGAVGTLPSEFDTVAASTVSIVKLDAGEGANYERGYASLVKHAANPWEVRFVESVSTDDLNMSFDLNNAPPVSTNLGDPIAYLPRNSGHPSLTTWAYVGNGGAVQMISGCRVLSYDISIDAAALINGSFSLEGRESYYNPIEVDATNNAIDLTDDGGTIAVIVPSKTYKDPIELADAIATVLNGGSAETYTCVYNEAAIDGKFTIATSSSALLSLLWNTGVNTTATIGATIGFSTAADDTGALTYTSDNAQVLTAPYDPVFDPNSPDVALDNEFFLGDQQDNVCFQASSISISPSNTNTRVLDICEVSGVSGSAFTDREVTISVTGILETYDTAKWANFRANDTISWQYNSGKKSGGNWVAGKIMALYGPTAKVVNIGIVDEDSIARVQIELSCFVQDGKGEIFIAQL